MSDKNNSNNNEHETNSLGPISGDKRIIGNFSYLMMWLGGCVSIGNFSLGSSLVGGGLNLIQATLAVTIGSLIVVICLVFNDQLSYKTGIPYVVQLRSAFGFKGTIIPAFCRSIPAIVWYGFQSWVGASALNEVSKLILNYDNIIFYFIAFHVFQIGLSVLGFKGIKVVENVGGVVIILSLLYMLITILSLHGDVVTELSNQKGTWGIKFFSAITAFIGVNCAVLINVGDYVRELKLGAGRVKRGVVYSLALIPATVFMGVIGLLVTQVTGNANPVVGFAQIVPNKGVVVLTLIFIVFAQITTNLLNNALPPIYAIMDAFKIKYSFAAIGVGLAAFVTFPWELIKESSASGLNLFILIYSAFLGPIFSILITDYYFIKKQNVPISELYNPEGKFKGINMPAIGALVVGVIFSFIFVDISWLASLLPTGITYYILCKKTTITHKKEKSERSAFY